MTHHAPAKAFVIAAASSGSGKTTVTMGIITALRRRGLTVQPFKVGPDYIDSAYHSKLAERPCINLDSWMTSPDFVRSTFTKHCAGADIAIVEGVMGLFDGAPDGSGSTAQIAELLDLPILHVIDAGKSAQTAAAVLHGLETFNPRLRACGAIFNRIAGSKHWKSIQTTATQCRAPLLGYLPKNKDLVLPERQLGLVSAHEHGLPESYLDTLATAIEAHIDIDRLCQNAMDMLPEKPTRPSVAPTIRLGIAKDEAFCFYYQDNLDLLEQAGIDLVPFSPLHDPTLPEKLDGIYFGGGFPEEFTGHLADNTSMLESIRTFNGKILAECGGLIYLTKPLVGRIDGCIKMTDSLQACGYRNVTFNRDTILGPKGTKLRGHEFHWSQWVEKPSCGYGALQTDDQAWGYADDRIFASYFHIHFGSNPDVAGFFKDRLMK